MATVSLNQVVQLTIFGTYCGQRWMNTFPHYVQAVPGVLLEQASVFDALNTVLNAPGKLYMAHAACRPVNAVHDDTWMQVIRNVRFRKFTFTQGDAGTFTLIPGLTANVQASITRLGELANRHEIGGIRIPIGTDDSCFDDGELTPALKGACELLANEMRADKLALGYTFRPLVGLTAPAYPFAALETTDVQETVRVIRRRTVRLGI